MSGTSGNGNHNNREREIIVEGPITNIADFIIEALVELPLVRIALFAIVAYVVLGIVYSFEVGWIKGLLYLVPVMIFARIASFVLEMFEYPETKIFGVLFVLSIESGWIKHMVNIILTDYQDMAKVKSFLLLLFGNINHYALILAAICLLIRVFKGLFLQY